MSTTIVNAIVIDAPFDLLWDMTNDVESWTSLFTEYAAVDILSRDDTSVTFRLTTHADPEGRTWTWVSRRDLDRASYTVRARRVETGPFEYMHILWQYLPVTGGVELRWTQDFMMKADAHVDDAAMAEHLNGNARREMARIKEVIEKAAHRQHGPSDQPRYDGIFTPWIYVRDAAAAADWYSRVLGLEAEFRLDGHGWCELGTGIDRVAIGLHQADHGHHDGATLTLGVLDLDAELARLSELGVKLDGPVTTIPGLIKMASFRDPDGNPLMLCQVLRTPRHRAKPR